MKKPKYAHECIHCIFLGSVKIKSGDYRGKLFDLYYCSGGKSKHQTIIARDGNKEYEYMSGIEIAKSIIHNNSYNVDEHPLVIAYNIAKSKSFII